MLNLHVMARPELKELRNKQDMSQREFASLFNTITGRKISRSYYSHIEDGRVAVPVEQAIKFANCFNKKLETLFINRDALGKESHNA